MRKKIWTGSGFLNHARKTSSYKEAMVVNTKKTTREKKRIFPNIECNNIIIIGIDQAVVNTGFGLLYFNRQTGETIPFSLYGDCKNNADLINSLIIINDKHRSEDWPAFQSAFVEFVNKIDIVKELIRNKTVSFGINELDVKYFVVVESVYFGKYKHMLKNLIRQQTLTIEHMLDIGDVSIYEYESSRAKRAVGVGAKKDAVNEAVNKLFNLNMPTINDVANNLFTQKQYEFFTHIGDGYALAYAFLKDFLISPTIVNLFPEEN